MDSHKALELIGLSDEFAVRASSATNPLEKAQWSVMAEDYRRQALKLALANSEEADDPEVGAHV
jgi:hypothetical protein